MNNIAQVANSIYKNTADQFGSKRLEGWEIRGFAMLSALGAMAAGIGVMVLQTQGHINLPMSGNDLWTAVSTAPYVVGAATMVGLYAKQNMDTIKNGLSSLVGSKNEPSLIGRLMDKFKSSANAVEEGIKSNPAADAMMQQVQDFRNNAQIFISSAYHDELKAKDKNYIFSEVQARLQDTFESVVRAKIEKDDYSPVTLREMDKAMAVSFGLNLQEDSPFANITERAIGILERERADLGLKTGEASKFLAQLTANNPENSKKQDGPALG